MCALGRGEEEILVSVFASLFGKETLLGLDIGGSVIKAMQVEPQRGRFKIVRAVQQPTPPGAVRDGIVLDGVAVSEAIQQMLKAAGMTATSAVLAVSGPTVIVRQITMPKLSEAVLKKSIRYEASKYITTNLEESALAFEILGPNAEDDSQMDVMLVAAPRELVDSRIAAVERAGLDAISVDIEAFALRRALVDLNRDAFDDDGLRAVVDIGATHTEVILLSGTQFALTRFIPISGDTFTDAIKNQLRLEVSEAEAKKSEADMSVLVSGAGEPTQIELARILQATIDELLREIRRSINYFQSQLAEGQAPAPLTEILLIGGAAQIPGIAPYMTARLGTDTRLCDPFDSPYLEMMPEAEEWLRAQGPHLGVALGLAVKENLNALGGKA